MKRAGFILTLALLPLLGACKTENGTIHGYVEGEFVMVAPTTSGLLQTLDVVRGQAVKKDEKLFSLDLSDLSAQQKIAAANLTVAEANLEDLLKGQRPEELDIQLEQKKQAEAALADAEKEFQRVKALIDTKAVSRAAYDKADTDYRAAEGRLGEINAQIKASNLGARVDKITAARASVEGANHALSQINKRLVEASPISPSDAQVQDTFYRVGEYVMAGQPVVSLLPPENIKIRFFVGEAELPKFTPGQSVRVTCDGCKGVTPAKITYVSSQAEYTPPVIYSVGSRDKLVFMIEAKPGFFSADLRPGLPVDIEPGTAQ